MEIIAEKAAMRVWSRQQRTNGRRIAFVPTMGHLHLGHLSLVREAMVRGDRTVVSIYVNPTQFGPNEDFDVYPRDIERDIKLLQQQGCDAVFLPKDLYAQDVAGQRIQFAWVSLDALSSHLCGASRPGFFRGVATVVTKLFNIIEPQVAVFGRKDYQQWRIVEQLVRDLDFDIDIIAMPIVREADGLAMSSRNARLNEGQRASAVAIPRTLDRVEEAVRAGLLNAQALCTQVRSALEGSSAQVDYVQLVDPETLQPVDSLREPSLMAVAAFYGDIRLIDNRELEPIRER
jgi:pantoate--beta-alanine ligase